jgi:hypothetical protein
LVSDRAALAARRVTGASDVVLPDLPNDSRLLFSALRMTDFSESNSFKQDSGRVRHDELMRKHIREAF